jgi:Tat protein translocase TatC
MLMVFVCDGIGLLTGTRFGIGRPMLEFIVSPVEDQLEEFDANKSKKILREVDKKTELRRANRPRAVRMSFIRSELESINGGGITSSGLSPLPENGRPLPYADLVARAQLQVNISTAALNKAEWGDLKSLAEDVKQTALRLLTATKVPEDYQNGLSDWANEVAKEAERLGENADKKDAVKAEDGLISIQDLLGDQELVSRWVRIDEPVEFFASLSRAQGRVSGKYRLSTLNPMEAFMAYFKVSLVCGVVLGSPWIFMQIWSFIAAGLYPHEKRLVNVYLPFSLILFLIGALACQFVVIPKAVGALLWFNEWLDLQPELRFNEWLSFAILMPLVFGISFQLPLVMMFLERLGIMTVPMYYSYWKIAFFLIHVVAAILMPTPDIISMECLALPMFGLYGLGILLCRLNPGKSEQDQDVPQSEEMVEV